MRRCVMADHKGFSGDGIIWRESRVTRRPRPAFTPTRRFYACNRKIILSLLTCSLRLRAHDDGLALGCPQGTSASHQEFRQRLRSCQVRAVAWGDNCIIAASRVRLMHGYGRQTRFSKSAWRIGPLIDACLVGGMCGAVELCRPPQVNKPKGSSDAWDCLGIEALRH